MAWLVFITLWTVKSEARPLYDESLKLYLDQILDFFPALSEKEKSAFYTKIKPEFEGFQDFAVSYYLSDPTIVSGEVLSQLYNLQLSTKALLLNASNKVRERIMSSGDQDLIDSYSNWLNTKEKLLKYYSFTKEELSREGVDLKMVEEEINNLEKTLSAKSELFTREFEKEFYSWHDVKNSLKENEAALEIIRIKKKTVPDSIYYIGLIVTPTTKDHPALVVIENGSQLESRLFNYYRNAIKLPYRIKSLMSTIGSPSRKPWAIPEKSIFLLMAFTTK